MVKCRADHRVKMANRTSEATREVVAEATSNVDVEEVDKVAEVATTRTLINQEAHNNKGTRWDQTRWWATVWTKTNRWTQASSNRWCLSSRWWCNSRTLNSNRCLSRTPYSFLKSMLRNLINFREMRETTLLVTTSTCQLCRPLVRNSPQPSLVCFLTNQPSTSSSCFLKTSTLSQKPERLMTFLFRASNNSSKLKCRASHRWTNERLEYVCNTIFIRTGYNYELNIMIGFVNKSQSDCETTQSTCLLYIKVSW